MDKEKLIEIAKKILAANPDCALSGSLGLHLQGIKTRREPVDIDIYMPWNKSLIEIEGMTKCVEVLSEEDYENEEYNRHEYKVNGIKIDILTPIEEYVPIILKRFSGGLWVIPSEDIIKFKVLFALGKSTSKYKHRDDIIHFLINN